MTKIFLRQAEGKQCFLCGVNRAQDMHEAITRGRVRGNKEALQQVFASPLLCAYICKDCHADDSSGRKTIRKKVERYGIEPVRKAIEQVNAHLKLPIRIEEYLTD